MSTDSTVPDTIVLIHGLWMTPRSWEHWIPYYENRGFRVLAPGYPGFDVEVEALRADPSPITTLTVPDTVAHLEGVIAGVDKPPIIIGHSFGGTLTQLLLDRGHGAAGVVINSAPTEGVRVTPLSQVRSLFPFLDNPANRHKPVGFTPEQFHYTFCNTLSEQESAKVYERYHIPAPGSWVWSYGLLANFTPGRQETWVDYANDARAPLLFIAGGADHHHAGLGEPVERQALRQSQCLHRLQGVPRSLALDVRRGRLGADRRLRPRVGEQPRDRGDRDDRGGPKLRGLDVRGAEAPMR